jgi:hypothetical protein
VVGTGVVGTGVVGTGVVGTGVVGTGVVGTGVVGTGVVGTGVVGTGVVGTGVGGGVPGPGRAGDGDGEISGGGWLLGSSGDGSDGTPEISTGVGTGDGVPAACRGPADGLRVPEGTAPGLGASGLNWLASSQPMPTMVSTITAGSSQPSARWARRKRASLMADYFSQLFIGPCGHSP